MNSASHHPSLVLVVDDDELNRTLACAQLERLGWQVFDCTDGPDALEFLATHVPRWVLLDIRMPGLDGVAVARHIAQHTTAPKPTVVAYTAQAMSDELAALRRHGFATVLVKPVTGQDIERVFGTPAHRESSHAHDMSHRDSGTAA